MPSLGYDIILYFKSQACVCVQMNPPHLQDKKPECFVGNATYFVSEIIMIQEKQDLKTKITPFK